MQSYRDREHVTGYIPSLWYATDLRNTKRGRELVKLGTEVLDAAQIVTLEECDREIALIGGRLERAVKYYG